MEGSSESTQSQPAIQSERHLRTPNEDMTLDYYFTGLAQGADDVQQGLKKRSADTRELRLRHGHIQDDRNSVQRVAYRYQLSLAGDILTYTLMAMTKTKRAHEEIF